MNTESHIQPGTSATLRLLPAMTGERPEIRWYSRGQQALLDASTYHRHDIDVPYLLPDVLSDDELGDWRTPSGWNHNTWSAAHG